MSKEKNTFGTIQFWYWSILIMVSLISATISVWTDLDVSAIILLLISNIGISILGTMTILQYIKKRFDEK